MCRSKILLASIALFVSTNAIYAQLLDHEGNPLPKGAIARVGSTRMRHGGSVIGLSYLDDGKTLVSLTSEEVRWWDAATGKRKHGLDQDFGYPRAFRFSKDGQWFQLYTVGDLATISSRDGKELRRHKLTEGDEFKTVVAAEAGLLATVEDNSLRLFDMETGKEKHRIKPPAERPLWPAISQDGSTIALSYYSHDTVDVFDAKSGQLRTSVPRPAKDARRLFLSDDGKTLIVGGNKEPTDMWDLTGPRKISTVTGEAAQWTRFPVCAAFSPDGKRVALGSQWKYTAVIETATGKEVHRLVTFPSCMAVAFSPDGKTLTVGTNNGEVTQWDVQTGKPRAASADPIGPYIAFAFENGDKHILASNDRHLLLDWRSNKVVQRFPQTPNYLPMKNSLHLKTSLLGYFDYENERVVMCDAASGKTKWQVKAKTTWARVLLSPDGTLLITAHDDGFRGWDAQTGKSLLTIKTTLTNDELYRLAISPNNQWLATSHQGAGIRVWDLRKKELAGDFRDRPGQLDGLTFSHDSRWLAVVATGDAQNLYSWAVHKINVPRGPETVLQSTIGHKSNTEFAISPDDRSVATVSYYDDSIHLYEVAADQERCRFKVSQDTLFAVIFSADGSLLATSSNAGPLLIWDVYGKHQRKGEPKGRWEGAEQERLWQALASAKATEGFAAVCQLVQHPPAALVLLRERMKPARAVDVKMVRPLLADLQSEQFATRQKAFVQLEKMGDAIAGFLEAELPGIDNLEAKRRVERLLEKWTHSANPELLRWNRALEALEQIATEPARRLVADLAAGDPISRTTRLAQETRDRLERRPQTRANP